MASLNFLLNPVRGLAWRWVKATIHKRFSAVQAVSTDALAAWLAQEPPPLLLDVRQPEEFAVSHLPGALLAPDLATALAQIDPETKRPIVVYCSVGYRSARLADQLQAAHPAPVYNLEGSIFQWFNEGRPVVQGQRVADRVHPYSRVWGLLLAPR